MHAMTKDTNVKPMATMSLTSMVKNISGSMFIQADDRRLLEQRAKHPEPKLLFGG